MAVRYFLVASVLLVLLFSISSVPCNAQVSRTQTYDTYHLDALQALWNDWNKSTLDAASNLAGWNSTQPYPCNQYITGDLPNWRGVECLTNIKCQPDTPNDTQHENCNAFVIGLTLNNASIVGTLPPDIGNITTLTTLE